MASWIRAQIGSFRVRALPNSRRLLVLDPVSAAIWDLKAARVSGEGIASRLADALGVDIDAAQGRLRDTLAGWRRAAVSPDITALPVEDAVEAMQFPEPEPVPPHSNAWLVASAGRAIAIHVPDPGLRRRLLQPLLASPAEPWDGSALNRIDLLGDAGGWQVLINGARVEEGEGADDALVAMIVAVSEVGCRPAERLLVAHGAGLVSPQGRGFLLVAPGGSGKSTLAMALESRGHQLLSDDVTPVALDGSLVGLGLPMCLKRGSWDIAAHWRPEAEPSEIILRMGEPVRYLAGRGPAFVGSCQPSAFFFPRYCPGEPAACRIITPEQALKELVEAEAVIRDLTEDRLNAICRWISACPSYALHYPDLGSGIELLEAALARS
jgi:hypothetical protein